MSNVSIAVAAEDFVEGVVAVDHLSDGGVVGYFIGEDTQSLIEVTWHPGDRIALRKVALSAAAPRHVINASLAGHLVAMGSAGAVVLVLDRQTGAVQRLQDVQQPACLAPDGRSILSAPSTGLVQHALRRGANGALLVGPAQRLAHLVMDSPRSITVVPGAGESLFDVVIGDYGALAHFEVHGLAGDAPDVRGRSLSSGGLPYDPIHAALPAPTEGGQGRWVYLVDWGRCGVVAVDAGQLEPITCPLGPNAYNRVFDVVPRTDGRACYVCTREAELLWAPGREPIAIGFGTRRVLLWHRTHVLLLDEAAERLREEAIGDRDPSGAQEKQWSDGPEAD